MRFFCLSRRIQKSDSIGVQFPLILTLEPDRRIVFSITRILLFIDRMHTAAVLSISVGVIDLDAALLLKTFGKFRKRIGQSNIQIQSVYAVMDGFVAYL